MKIIIVGHGISGAVLAARALICGMDVCVIDRERTHAPSRAAAGLWNPVTFKKPALVWNAARFIPELNSFYPQMEKFFQRSFFHPKSYFRIFSEPEEVDRWIEKFSDPEFSDFGGTEITYPKLPVKAPYGAAKVKEAGYVDVPVMLESGKKTILQKGDFFEEDFLMSRLTVRNSGVSYKTQNNTVIDADHLIFADGPQVLKNPFFNFLDFRPVKGEVLTVKIPRLNTDAILSKRFFLLPAGAQLYLAGATYSRKELTAENTGEARRELENKLRNCIDLPFEVVSQKAGIRPATKDRKPVMGTHPQEGRIHLFNGMGSRAVMMVPKLAKDLLDYLQHNSELDQDVDIARFLRGKNRKG